MKILIENSERFIQQLAFEKKSSLHTIKAYSFDISSFINYCQNFSEISLEDISPLFISDWIQSLSKLSLGPRSISRKLSVLRSFFSFLEKKNIIVSNPFLLFSSPKFFKHIPTTLSSKEMMVVLESMPVDNICHRRNKYMLLLMYCTGIRSEELCNISCSDVVMNQGFIKIFGKGGKERLIPLISAAKNAICQWLEERHVLDCGRSKALFLSYRGNILTTAMIRKIVADASVYVPNKKLHAHAFRYTFASLLLDRGANLRHIQEILGHANLSVTQRYTKISVNTLMVKYREFHPRG